MRYRDRRVGWVDCASFVVMEELGLARFFGFDEDSVRPRIPNVSLRRGAMGIKGIDHWVIVAGDLERTLSFYARLGFTIAWEQREGRPRMPTIRINDAQKINVHGPDWPARPGYLGARRPAVGGADFCLEWAGTVQEVLDLLRDNGITPEAGPGTRSCARGPSTSVYFRDPDDNLVELTVYDHRP